MPVGMRHGAVPYHEAFAEQHAAAAAKLREAALMEERGFVPAELQADLDRLDSAGIPRDIVFEQGMSVLFGGG